MENVSSDFDSMAQYAATVQESAAQLAATKAFDPSAFQGAMMVGFGPAGMPFTTAFMGAVMSQMARTTMLVASKEQHAALVIAAKEGYSGQESTTSDTFDSTI